MMRKGTSLLSLISVLPPPLRPSVRPSLSPSGAIRRRRPKQLRNDMSITLVNSDNTLKTPLMNPKLSTFSETNGKVDGSPTGYQTPGKCELAECMSHDLENHNNSLFG
ncbi:unnamed protein product [Echinostoma caproni]|uniref:Secreted protein n=1 Tax=Echinostoma caproni TaxID=27848 RepID=A0A183B769_9TREM|nr:unnamed protein product [Echinostoma caproni]